MSNQTTDEWLKSIEQDMFNLGFGRPVNRGNGRAIALHAWDTLKGLLSKIATLEAGRMATNIATEAAVEAAVKQVVKFGRDNLKRVPDERKLQDMVGRFLDSVERGNWKETPTDR